ncbi:hypothetical protein YC2023_089697 [Brassica napus]
MSVEGQSSMKPSTAREKQTRMNAVCGSRRLFRLYRALEFPDHLELWQPP